MKEALDFLRDNNEVAFATVGEGNRPQIRVFQIMKMEDTTLWFATGPRKRVYAELQVNPAVEILSRNGNVSVRVSGDAIFDVPDEICRQIYDTNPVLQRLYSSYKDLVYFRMEIDKLDYYDLTPTPPVLRHYDRATGEYKDLSPFGAKK
jgi:uncharacterized pyridoxamine 5'-phosphate oxidase family protein